jgi:hypothetical protein
MQSTDNRATCHPRWIATIGSCADIIRHQEILSGFTWDFSIARHLNAIIIRPNCVIRHKAGK